MTIYCNSIQSAGASFLVTHGTQRTVTVPGFGTATIDPVEFQSALSEILQLVQQGLLSLASDGFLADFLPVHG